MWAMFKNWIFDVIQLFYNWCGDWGLAIIIVTVIFRIILTPIMHSQAKSNFKMQKIQPELAKIQEKYGNDQVRQSQEMQKLYADAKYNPIAGCVPMLLQLPIFMALFQVLRQMGEREEVHDYCFYNIIPNLVTTPSGAFAEGFFNFVPYLVLMLIFAGASFIPMIIQQRSNQNNSQKNQTIIMSVVMMVFMIWISWSSPAGVLLFWGVSSLIGICQNQFTLYRCRKADAIEQEEKAKEVKPVEVNVTRKVKKARPKKKH